MVESIGLMLKYRVWKCGTAVVSTESEGEGSVGDTLARVGPSDVTLVNRDVADYVLHNS